MEREPFFEFKPQPEREEPQIEPEKKEYLLALGITSKKAQEYLASHFTIEKLKEKVDLLKNAGFENPVELIEKHPPIAGLNIERVIENLKNAGFESPVELIEKYPPIAGLNIERVIRSLKNAGFENPVELIEKHPPIAGYNIERVKARIKLIERLNRKFNLDYDPINVIENFPQYLSYRKERLFFYLRLASFYKADEEFYRNYLITKNPFLLFSELSTHLPQDQEELKKMINSLSKLSKKERDSRINKVKEDLPKIIENLKNLPKETAGKDLLLKLAINLERQKERK